MVVWKPQGVSRSHSGLRLIALGSAAAVRAGRVMCAAVAGSCPSVRLVACEGSVRWRLARSTGVGAMSDGFEILDQGLGGGLCTWLRLRDQRHGLHRESQ